MKVLLLFLSFLVVSSCFENDTLNVSRHENEKNKNTFQSSSLLKTFEREKLIELRKFLLDFGEYNEILDNTNITQQCKIDFQEYLKNLMNFELWALEMYDSSAKISSGLLSGNINNFGDFDECLHVQQSINGIRGQYCLAYIKINVPQDMLHVRRLKELSHSLETFQSNFTKGLDDLYHYIPIFSSFLWSSCLPSTCSYTEFIQVVQGQFNKFLNGTDIQAEVKSENNLCQSQMNTMTLSTSTNVVLFFVAALVVIIIVTTLYDFMALNPEDTNGTITSSFSLVRNWKELMTVDEYDENDVRSVHGIRFVAVLMIFISHKSFFIYFYPMANRTNLIAETFKGSTVLIRAGFLYTELFLMISGFLAAYSLLRRLEERKKINFLKEYFDRYLRIMPSVLALILFTSHIMPYIGSGPLYKILTEREAELCSKYWWRNLLFINIWFGVRPMCGFHTQHVSIDFELFLVAPFFVAFIYKLPKKGIKFLIATAIVSSVAKCLVAYQNNLSEFIIHGLTSRQLFETADLMYILPQFRFTSYAMGILAGCVIKRARDVKISSTQLYSLWTLTLSAMFLSLTLASKLTAQDYQYNPLHASAMTFLPIPFCFFFILIIFTSEMKYSNFLTNFLEWKGFKVTTKLSYSFYLVQFVVFSYNTGSARGSTFYNLIQTGIDCDELVFILLGTFLLTLCVEIPVKNLRKSLFRDRIVKRNYDELQKNKIK